MQTLQYIASLYGTDKVAHNYCGVYERYFEPLRHRPIRLMEFGVDKGASIRTWLEYFPCATVVGCDCVDCADVGSVRYSFFRGMITDPAVWAQVGMCDIIIDDNGHRGDEAIAAIKLGLPHVNPGGLFIVEDTHTWYNTMFTPADSEQPMAFMRRMIDEQNDYGRGETGDNRNDSCPTEFIHFWKSLVIIGKR